MNFSRATLVDLLLFLFVACSIAQNKTDSPTVVFVKAGRLIDVRAGKVLEAQGILIEGERDLFLSSAGRFIHRYEETHVA
jgi:hypothetical protein